MALAMMPHGYLLLFFLVMLANKQRMTYRELEIMKRSDRHGKPRAHRGIDWFDRGRTTRHVTVVDARRGVHMLREIVGEIARLTSLDQRPS